MIVLKIAAYFKIEIDVKVKKSAFRGMETPNMVKTELTTPNTVI